MSSNKKTDITYKMHINTNLPGSSYWIILQRDGRYLPQRTQIRKNVANQSNKNDWKEVESKKKEKDKPIYYWVVKSHNLFDRRDQSYRLFFIEPNSAEIENMDEMNHMAIDENGELILVHSRLKHSGMKMNPTFYIAKNIKQIEEALKHVKYCVVKIDHNEQKLIKNRPNFVC